MFRPARQTKQADDTRELRQEDVAEALGRRCAIHPRGLVQVLGDRLEASQAGAEGSEALRTLGTCVLAFLGR